MNDSKNFKKTSYIYVNQKKSAGKVLKSLLVKSSKENFVGINLRFYHISENTLRVNCGLISNKFKIICLETSFESRPCKVY